MGKEKKKRETIFRNTHFPNSPSSPSNLNSVAILFYFRKRHCSIAAVVAFVLALNPINSFGVWVSFVGFDQTDSYSSIEKKRLRLMI